jgi:hypothetical protein
MRIGPAAHLLIAAQVYGAQNAPPSARTQSAAFDALLVQRQTAKKPVNPTLSDPAPQTLTPAKRFDEGAGKKDAPLNASKPAPQRPGSQLDIRV